MSETKSEEQHLEKTIDALENSIEKESQTGSTASINSWIKTLTDRPGYKTIAHDLEKLQKGLYYIGKIR
jgi:hypothetical protein